MLTADDCEALASHGWLYDHAWRFTSLLAGEPFLIGGSLVQFDGRHLYVLDFPILRDLAGVSGTFGELLEQFNPELVWYSGERQVPAAVVPEHLKIIHTCRPDPDDLCMEIPVADFRLEADSRRAGWIRAGQRRNYRSAIRSPGFLGYRHISLIESFVQRHRPGDLARSFIGVLGAFVRQPQSCLVEVWCGERLAAFGVVEGWFHNMDVFLYGFSCHEFPGAFDFLMWSLIANAQERGRRTLNVGYSINAGIRAFKQKWGAHPCSQGYFDQLWHRCGHFQTSHTYWPHRLLVRGQHGSVDAGSPAGHGDHGL